MMKSSSLERSALHVNLSVHQSFFKWYSTVGLASIVIKEYGSSVQ